MAHKRWCSGRGLYHAQGIGIEKLRSQYHLLGKRSEEAEDAILIAPQTRHPTLRQLERLTECRAPLHSSELRINEAAAHEGGPRLAIVHPLPQGGTAVSE